MEIFANTEANRIGVSSRKRRWKLRYPARETTTPEALAPCCSDMRGTAHCPMKSSLVISSRSLTSTWRMASSNVRASRNSSTRNRHAEHELVVFLPARVEPVVGNHFRLELHGECGYEMVATVLESWATPCSCTTTYGSIISPFSSP